MGTKRLATAVGTVVLVSACAGGHHGAAVPPIPVRSLPASASHPPAHRPAAAARVRARLRPKDLPACRRSAVRLGRPSLGGGLGTRYQIVPIRNLGVRPCVVAVARAWYTTATGRQIGRVAVGEPGLDGRAILVPAARPARLITGVTNPANFETADRSRTPGCWAVQAHRLIVVFVGIGRYVVPAGYPMCRIHNVPSLRVYGSGGDEGHEN